MNEHYGPTSHDGMPPSVLSAIWWPEKRLPEWCPGNVHSQQEQIGHVCTFWPADCEFFSYYMKDDYERPATTWREVPDILELRKVAA